MVGHDVSPPRAQVLVHRRQSNPNGQRPRPYAAYSQLLAKLDDLRGLTDGAGKPVAIQPNSPTTTHPGNRASQRRGTDPRRAALPRSPEITLRYAATLAATAEAEFLKHKKIGAQASLKTLAAHTQKRRDSVDTRAPKALQGLRREKADITISSVARRAGVTRKSIHNRPKLLAQIEAHRTLAVVSDEPQSASGGAESGIIAALRNRLTVKDTDRAATS